jgi:hypothetical protein
MAVLKSGFIITILLAFSVGGVSIVNAEGPYQNPANGHYYELVDDPFITWHSAVAAAAFSQMPIGDGYCRDGHLATITSQEENDFIVNTFGAPFLRNKWLGGFQTSSNANTSLNGWIWITAEPWKYSNWGKSEPSNFLYNPYGYEDALTFGSNGAWNDAPSKWDKYPDGGYIVEYDCEDIATPTSIPEPVFTIPLDSLLSVMALTCAGLLVLFRGRE